MIQWVTLETHWSHRREMGVCYLFFPLTRLRQTRNGIRLPVKLSVTFCCRRWEYSGLFFGFFLYEAIKKGKKDEKKNRTRLRYALFEYQLKSRVCKLALVRSKFRAQQHERTRVEASARHLVMFLPWIAKNFPIRRFKEQKGIWKCLSWLYQTPPSRAFLEWNFPPCVSVCLCLRSHWLTVVGSEEEAVPHRVSWHHLDGALDSGWWENYRLKWIVWGAGDLFNGEKNWFDRKSHFLRYLIVFKFRAVETCKQQFGCSGWKRLF